MIQEDAVVNRYVKALYEVSVTVGRRSEILQQVQKLRDFFAALKDAEKICKRFSLMTEEGRPFVEELVKKFDLLPEVGNFLKVILYNKRFSAVGEICSTYVSFADRAIHNKKTFYVTYARRFSEQDRIRLTEKLKEVFSGDIECVSRQDESLIDGIKIQYRSKVLDYSTKSKLTRLGRVLRGDNYEN